MQQSAESTEEEWFIVSNVRAQARASSHVACSALLGNILFLLNKLNTEVRNSAVILLALL